MKILQRYDIDPIYEIVFCDTCMRSEAITCASNSRDIAKSMVRVKSSNMWSYTIDVKNYEKQIGDVYVQFKDKHGGPGDVYMYFDVPVKLYRRWVSAPSKGHFFWEFIRNNFKYRKLTGDKRGKLANAVN